MSRGYPDDFGMSIFPSKGPFNQWAGGITLEGLCAFTTVIDINAKGTIYGGYLRCVDDDLDLTSHLRLTIDGTATPLRTLTDLFERSQGEGYYHPLKVFVYSTVPPRFSIELRPDIDFGINYKIELDNNSANLVTWVHEFYYSWVTG